MRSGRFFDASLSLFFPIFASAWARFVSQAFSVSFIADSSDFQSSLPPTVTGNKAFSFARKLNTSLALQHDSEPTDYHATLCPRVYSVTFYVFLFQPLTDEINYYYLIEVGFTLSLLVSMFVDVKRKVCTIYDVGYINANQSKFSAKHFVSIV